MESRKVNNRSEIELILRSQKVGNSKSQTMNSGSKSDMHIGYAYRICMLPWKARTQSSYLDELAERLVRVELGTPLELQTMIEGLQWLHKYPWGRRIHKSGGRRWGLKHHDKLILGGHLLSNAHGLEHLSTPCVVWFFRADINSGIANSSIMFNIPGLHNLGVDHFEMRHFVDCTLHTLDLGVGQRYIATCFVHLLRKNVFECIHTTLYGKMVLGMQKMKACAKKYYNECDKNSFGKVSRLRGPWTLAKLGKLDNPCLHAKGAESRTLVKFCAQIVDLYKEKLGREGALLAAAGTFVNAVALMVFVVACGNF